MLNFEEIKKEIISTFHLDKEKFGWFFDANSIEMVKGCLNDLIGQIVWFIYGRNNDSVEKRKIVADKLISILNKYDYESKDIS